MLTVHELEASTGYLNNSLCILQQSKRLYHYIATGRAYYPKLTLPTFMRVASFSGSPLHAPMKKCKEEPGKYYMMVDIGQLPVLPHNSQMLMDTTPHTFSPRLLIAHRPRTPGTIFLHDLCMSTIAHSGRCNNYFISLLQS